jgi:polysaccharide pyruvyl transferase WcaK-like protein
MSPDNELTRVLQSYQIAYQDKSAAMSNRFKIPAFQYVQDSSTAQQRNAQQAQFFSNDQLSQHMWS